MTTQADTPAEAPGGRLFLRVFPSIMLPMFLASVDATIVAAAGYAQHEGLPRCGQALRPWAGPAAEDGRRRGRDGARACRKLAARGEIGRQPWLELQARLADGPPARMPGEVDVEVVVVLGVGARAEHRREARARADEDLAQEVLVPGGAAPALGPGA